MNEFERQQQRFWYAQALIARASGKFSLATRFSEHALGQSVIIRGDTPERPEIHSSLVPVDVACTAVCMAACGAGLAPEDGGHLK